MDYTELRTIDHILTTTRTVRKRLDLIRPVEPEVIEKCIEIATQAPTGSNAQGWHFVIVTDQDKRANIAELYEKSFSDYIGSGNDHLEKDPSSNPPMEQMMRVFGSAQYLANNMHKVPMLIIPCINGRVENEGPLEQASLYGSILPATWSLMLALRSRGLGSAWTTLHLQYEKEVAAILGIPNNVTMVALLPIAYYTGNDFKPAKRLPSKDLTHWNSWGHRR